MIKFDIENLNKNTSCVLSLGAESAGVFAIYKNGDIFASDDFGDLLDENNFLKYKKAILDYLKKEKIKPDIILTDLHPLYKTTIFGEELAKKLKARQVKVQHHVAHIFSAVGDKLLKTKDRKSRTSFFGITMDGTGYGTDGNIWGGEVFRLQMANGKWRIVKKIDRIGSMEEQIMTGGDLAVREPARMLIAILAKIPNPNFKIPICKTSKNFVYKYVKKFYTQNEFEVLYNQMEQDFNCQTTTSTGRILDAVSILLGFAGNERKYKHEAVKKLEENSTIAYDDIEPRIVSYGLRKILDTTYLFEYLIRNIKKDKRRLAATAQLYIAKGLYEIIRLLTISHKPLAIYAAGGMANNKIISSYLEKRGVYLSKEISRGDEGIAFGQIIYYLTNSRN